MKKLILLVILAFSMALSPLATTYAATPKVINYQGQLESDAITSKAPVLVVFELFEDAAGGSALWIEQKSVTVDKNGFFSVYLGDVNPIDLKFDKQYFVQVTVGNNQPFPRTKLSSTPSAFYAADADTALYANTAGLALKVAPKAINLSNLADEVLTAGGDLMGMYPNPQIKPSAIINNIPDGSITSEMLSPNISTSPSGPAGGDLFGSYPDPLIAVGAVKTDRIFDGAVTNQKIADGAVTNNKIVTLDAAKLTNVPALNFQVAVMTDATIDGDGTMAMPLSLADTSVSTSKIVDGAVTNAKVGANAITTDKILNETILAEDIATGAVTTSEILDGTILTADIADGAVTSAKILDETILASDIATGAVTTSEILNATILTEDLSDNAVTQAKLADDAVRVRNIDVSGAAPVNGDVLYFDGGIGEMRWGQENVQTSAPLTGNGTTLAPVTLDPTFGSADELLIRKAPSGWVSSKINTANINDAAITNVKLADNSVTTNKIVDGTIIAADLADGSVTSAKILDGTIITADLADGAVTTVKVADGAITTAKILDGDIQTIDIANKAVTNAKIEEDAVTGNKVLDGSLSSLDLNTTGVVPGIYGDPSASPSIIDVPEYKVDAQGRILTSKENSYTVLAAGTIFNESPVSDITVDGTYDNLDLQIKPGVVGTTELADNSVTTAKILDGTIVTADLADNSITSLKIIDGSVTSADIADGTIANIDLAPNSVASGNIIDGTIALADMGLNSVGTTNIIDNNVLNTKIGSGAQVAGKTLKADGAGNTVWGDDLGLTLPYTGSYPGPGDAFKLTHTGAAGNGSVAIFTSSTSGNTSDGVVINKGVDAGAGSALSVSGTGVKGTNYIAKMTNTNLAEGRTLLLENNAPVLATEIVDPNGIANDGDEFVKPDGTNTDLNDATLVVRNKNAAVSNQKLAIKTYGSIQANSTIQGTNLVAYGGQVTLLNPATGALATIMPPANVGDPLNITPALDLNGTSTVKGLNNIWESADGNLFPAGTGTDRDVPTALAVSNSIGSIAAEPFITFGPDAGGLTNNRVFAVNPTLTSTITAGDNNPITLEINLANANTWTGTQTLSAAGNGLVVTTASDLQGTIANSTGSVTVGDNFVVNGTSTLNGQTSITTAASNALQVNNNDVAPTAIFTNAGAGSSIEANGNVTVTTGGLNVTGATDLNTGLNVDGASTLDAVTIAGTLSQSGGQVTLAGNVDATAGLDVTGASTFAGTLTQTTAGDQVKFAGNVDANNGLDVTGAATVAGTLTQTTAGQVSFNGNVDAANGLDVTGGNFTLPTSPAVPVNEVVTTVSAASTDMQLPTAKATNTAIAAVAAEPFLTFQADGGTLTNNRVFAVTANLTNTIGGADNSNATLDLSNTGVAAASYGNNAGTSYSTFTVDAKGRLTAAATQAVVVDDAVSSDITISGAASNVLDLQIKTNAVGTNELATADYSGDLAVGNYVLGNLNSTIIGATTPAKGTFTNLVAQTDFTLGGQLVDDIATSADAPLTLDDTDLVTEGAVFTALLAHDLQVAYVNGNIITTSLAEGNVVIAGLANLDAQVNIINSSGDVTVNDNLVVTGNVSGVAGTFSGVVSGTDGTFSGNVTGVNGTFSGAVAATGNVSGANVTAANNVTATAGSVTAGTTVNAGSSVNAVTTVNAGTNVTAGGDVIATGNVSGVNGTFTGNVSGVDGTFTGNVATTGTTTNTGLTTTNGGLTMGAGQNFTMGGNAVNDIYTSADPTNPIAGTDAQLITALAVQNALAAHTLQTAYVNGNVITTDAGNGNVQIAGTAELDIDVNTTLNGNLTQVGNLGVTGATTLTGTLTQTGGAVSFGGPVAANNSLTVLAGATVSGGATIGGGATITSGGLAVQSGGITVTAGANNFGPGVSTFNGNVIANTVDIAGGAGSEIDNTVIGGNVAAAGTFTNLAATGTFTTTGLLTANGGLTVNGVSTLNGNTSVLGANTFTTGTGQVTFGGNVDANAGLDVTGNLVVTGTSDLQGVVSNSGGSLTVNDGVAINLQAAADDVTIQGAAGSTGAILNVNNANAANANGAITVASTQTGIAVSTSAANSVGISVSATAGANSTGISAGNNGTGANASIVANNVEGSSNAYALSVTNGHIQVSADAVVNNPATITVGANTMIRMTGTSGAAAITAGTQIGQILILTNEDAGTINITGAFILGGAYIMPAESALQLVWNGASWVRFQ